MISLQTTVKEPLAAEALGECAKAHRDRAYSIALRITRSAANAEDAVQEAALKLLGMRTEIQSLDVCESFFYRAVVQCSLDVLRGNSRRSRRESTYGEGGHHMRVAESAGACAEHGETLALLRDAVNGLSEDERLAVSLCFFEGLSVVDTARSLELPRETVRARLQRAMEKLRGYLKSKGHVIGAAVVLGLLWRDLAQSAPAALCEKLDGILPGRPCAQIAPAAPSAPVAAGEFTTAPALSSVWIASIAATVVLVAAIYFTQSPAKAPAAATVISSPPLAQPAQTIDEPIVAPKQSVETRADQARPKSETGINVTNAAPASPKANEAAIAPVAEEKKSGDTSQDLGQGQGGELADTIRSIEARNAAKAEARSRQIETQQRSERSERVEIQVNGGAYRNTTIRETTKTVPGAGINSK